MNRVPRLVAALVIVTSIGSLPACSQKKEDDGTTPQAKERQLPALTLRDDTSNLLLTWIDDKGNMHVELKPADVPEMGRVLVRVVVSDREEGTRDLFYVTDLTQKREDGTYPVRTMARKEWEAIVEKRRQGYLAKFAPPPTPVPSGSAASGKPSTDTLALTAIIYGADWCKPCHQADAYLRSKGVTVVHKDVDESPAAAKEMREKLVQSGNRGGSIPVIDVQGQIVVGFSPQAIDRAIAKARSGTVL